MSKHKISDCIVIPMVHLANVNTIDYLIAHSTPLQLIVDAAFEEAKQAL